MMCIGKPLHAFAENVDIGVLKDINNHDNLVEAVDP